MPGNCCCARKAGRPGRCRARRMPGTHSHIRVFFPPRYSPPLWLQGELRVGKCSQLAGRPTPRRPLSVTGRSAFRRGPGGGAAGRLRSAVGWRLRAGFRETLAVPPGSGCQPWKSCTIRPPLLPAGSAAPQGLYRALRF